MSQSLNFSFTGLYTSLNDYNGGPPGVVSVANNVESRYKNLVEPRRGFEELPDSNLVGQDFKRLQNFYVLGSDRLVGLTDQGALRYYTGGMTPWPVLPGDYSEDILNPNDTFAKSRLFKAGQNLYCTSRDGLRSLASGASSETLRAGVPKALNIEGATNGDLTGFFDNNTVLSTTGDISSGSALLRNLADTTGIAEGQYVAGIEVAATLVVQDLTYTAELFGTAGNAITITYTGGGTAGNEIVTVVGNAISVQIENSVSTATQISTKLLLSAPAMALVSVVVSGTGSNAQTTAASTPLAGGLDNTIPADTTVSSVTPESVVIIQTGDTTAGSTSVTDLASNAGIVPGLIVTGLGIADGTTVVSISGGGPYTVVLSLPTVRDGTAVELTFTSPIIVNLSQNAESTLNNTPIIFYTGAQVAYRIVYGRVESDINGNNTTRLGAPSTSVIVNNTTPYSTNVEITATLPKNSENLITFYQLYRSSQTDSIDISPLEQYQLVAEAQLSPSDFVNRTITISDETPDSLRGVALYSGTDQQGPTQANDPPPLAWDVCPFRDFMIYVNITRPTTLRFTIVSVGAPSGIQVGDIITISGTFNGNSFSQDYTAANTEDAVAREFEVYSSGTPSQNISDTANSLIRVLNYDDDLPVHAILLSSVTDLPGQILLEADYPSYDTFTITASANQSAYDPELDDVDSELNTINNGIAISKSGELEAVPVLNTLFAGDSSSNIVRCIPLRDYVFIIKTDGIYKLQGFSPDGLVCNPFDLTTKIIGSDTAVQLNSAVWMLSNQGVVSLSDGGVDAKSVPIDNQLNVLINSYLDALQDVAFGVGYESDRKYILAVPSGDITVSDTQYIFNYITSTWTTWDRRLRTGFIHSNEGKLYISKADGSNNAISKERKTGTFRDYVDEAISVTIDSFDGTEIVLADITGVSVGDILYQGTSIFSPILEIDITTNTVTVQSEFDWTLGAAEVQTAYDCDITWNQVYGDNPAFARQYSEGLILFKNTRFNSATLRFVTDYSQSFSNSEVEIEGLGNALWGLFPWGSIPWGSTNLPQTIRFMIPSSKQMGSIIVPSLNIRQGYSNFLFQGLAIAYENISIEVGGL